MSESYTKEILPADTVKSTYPTLLPGNTPMPQGSGNGSLLGHKDVQTTTIYTHVLQQGGEGVISPLEDL